LAYVPAVRAAVQRMVDNREMSTSGMHEEEVESRYEATFGVLIVIGLQATLAGVSLANGWTLIGLPGLVALIASLLSGHEKSGGELLLKGATI
jgi:hypothetical protein